MKRVRFYSALVLVLGVAACTSEDSLTEPGMPAEPSAVAAAAAANSWSMLSAYQWHYGLYGSAVAMAPNSSGRIQSQDQPVAEPGPA